MNHQRLTKDLVQREVRDADRITILRDRDTRGFYARHDPKSGVTRWHVQADQPRIDVDGKKAGKRSVSITLGLIDELSSAEARRLAGELKAKLIGGEAFEYGGKEYAPIDERIALQDAIQLRRKMQRLSKRTRSTVTLDVAMTEYLTKHPRKHETLKRQFVSAMQTHFGKYMQLPVTEITDAVIDGWYEPTHPKQKAAMHLRGILRFCNEERVPRINIDPQVFVQIRVLGKKYNTGTRKQRPLELKPHMLPTVMAHAETATPVDVWPDLIKLIAYTGLRKSEAAGLEWQHIDFADRSFTIPDTKNGQPLALAMSDQVHDLLMSRQGMHPRFVFGSDRFADDHPTRYSGSKTLTAWRDAVRQELNMPSLSVGLHQLRKLCRHTLAMKLRCPESLTDAIMNHSPASVGASNYSDRFDVEPKREPMQQLADHLDALVSGAAQ